MSRRKRPNRPGDRSDNTGAHPLWKRLAVVLFVPAVIVAVILLSPPGQRLTGLAKDGSPSGLRAAIVDQLSLTAPNAGFSDTATDTLQKAGYEVDYYAGERVTVNFYRNLPQLNYDLIILRTHSTAIVSRGEEEVPTVSIFTNEPYSRDRYYEEQVAGYLGFASYIDGGPQVFGITGDFIRSAMNGRFHDTVILMMGCDGLRNDEAAEAFIERGASSYVSWSEFVSANHTDVATERLLELLLAEKVPLPDAVARTNAEVGPDPTFGSELLYRTPQ